MTQGSPAAVQGSKWASFWPLDSSRSNHILLTCLSSRSFLHWKTKRAMFSYRRIIFEATSRSQESIRTRPLSGQTWRRPAADTEGWRRSGARSPSPCSPGRSLCSGETREGQSHLRPLKPPNPSWEQVGPAPASSGQTAERQQRHQHTCSICLLMLPFVFSCRCLTVLSCTLFVSMSRLSFWSICAHFMHFHILYL